MEATRITTCVSITLINIDLLIRLSLDAVQEGVLPRVKCANQIMDAFAATGNMHAVVDVLEVTVAAGLVPESGTVAALIGGCQRTRYFELAFQVHALLLAISAVLCFTTCYMLLLRTQ